MVHEYCLVGEVAAQLNCSAANVRVLERAGKLSALRTARGVRLFVAQEVRNLAAERRLERAAKR
jgi:DNA-binding transcriptional MerR regulator